MALEGFTVTRPVAARAGSSSSARANLSKAGVSVVDLTGRAGTSSNARGQLGEAKRFTGRMATATSARGALLVYSALPPPGVFAMLRNQVALILSTLDPDWEVHALPVDALAPPAFMLAWADPWTIPGTHCMDEAHLEVICVSARVDVEGGYETLEAMVEAALGAFNAGGFPHGETSAPRPFEIGGLTYLAARIQVHNYVTV